jgi:hypothetical protein
MGRHGAGGMGASGLPDPYPGGWNGGWEPDGAVCLFNLCI